MWTVVRYDILVCNINYVHLFFVFFLFFTIFDRSGLIFCWYIAKVQLVYNIRYTHVIKTCTQIIKIWCIVVTKQHKHAHIEMFLRQLTNQLYSSRLWSSKFILDHEGSCTTGTEFTCGVHWIDYVVFLQQMFLFFGTLLLYLHIIL